MTPSFEHPLSYLDIVDLLFIPGVYMFRRHEGLATRAYLQAYNQVVEGWIRNVLMIVDRV